MKCLPILVAVVAVVVGLWFYNGKILASDGRLLFSMFQGTLESTGQVADGYQYVLANAEKGNPESVLNAIDKFNFEQDSLINVGDAKGKYLDEAIKNNTPSVLLELGAYCGYSAVRMGRLLPPTAHLYSIELYAANAEIATKVVAHAGLQDRVTFIVGAIGDGGKTIQKLRDLKIDSVDLVFVDHWKEAYVPDTKTLEENGFIKKGTVVVADNIFIPGVPQFLKYITESPHYSSQLFQAEVHFYMKDAILVAQRLD